jgi:two-component system response regulator HydG
MRDIFQLVLRVAPRKQPVLITGESGTGKELVARAIHDHGPTPREPFVPVDCGALSANLIESELFGHVPGAFTGAAQRRIGLLASAGRGTIFLDEIGELPLELQSRLLRAIQEREFRALGSNERQTFAARIIAATNRDLQASVDEGKFRGDLFYRLNVLQIHLPPLRERNSDIPLLVQHFIELESQAGDPVRGISSEAMTRFQNHPWPGNVRELRNQVLRAITLTDGPTIQIESLARELRRHSAVADAPAGLTYLERVERAAVIEMLRESGGNRQEAARLLGVSKTTLYKKLKDYKLEEYEQAKECASAPAD